MGKRKRASKTAEPEGMSEELKAELKQDKKDHRQELHMVRLRKSQALGVGHRRRHLRRIEELKAGYFQRVYGDVWREVMEGIREETDAKLTAERNGDGRGG